MAEKVEELISMIAKRPRVIISTMLAMVLIMTFVTGCTITGESNEKTTPLTDDELSYFNGDKFFNGEYMNIRNQFLSSIYDAPGKVDLFQLFYCGSGIGDTLTEAEKSAVVAQNGWDMEPDCGCTKISRSNMDAVLSKNIGLTISDTEETGLESFTYLEKYDAYYNYHGDTNYRMEITFSKGEREGDIIRLFYDDVFFVDGEKVLTLREKDGSYLFVSNVYCETSNEDNTKEESDEGKDTAGLEPEQAVKSLFGLYLPGSGCSIYLGTYPVDFPFACDLAEKSRKSFRAESFGKVTVVESEDLQVSYLNPAEGVYTVITIRTVAEGCSSAGVAIGDTEEALLKSWSDKPLKKMDSISYDDEAWFGKCDLAYAYTPEEGTKSVVFLIRDGLVFGIEIVNGLDGAMY
jgi:hypothetical protein